MPRVRNRVLGLQGYGFRVSVRVRSLGLEF